VTVRDRVLVAVLLLGGAAAAVGVVVLAANLCPGPTPTDPCPDATRNQAIVVGSAALALALVTSGLAFVAEYLVRNRIVYRGAWARAARRGGLVGVALAAVAGLRLVDALTVFSAAVVVAVVVAIEWLAVRRLDSL
jgi:hypothetical protein